jgi:hypothetical protein
LFLSRNPANEHPSGPRSASLQRRDVVVLRTRLRPELGYALGMSTSSRKAGWSLDALRLPKAIEADARSSALPAALRQSVRKLWGSSSIEVPSAPWRESVASALAMAQREGHLVQGLEQAETKLAQQAHGMALADARRGAERGARVSRLLLIGNDGSERFYRQVERLVAMHAARLLPVWLDASSKELASVLSRPGGVVRALLIEHKDSVTRLLFVLYPGAAESKSSG